MGCWGMGIAQTDEYCEIFDRFMEEYDEGKPVADITKDILEEYLDEFSTTDGILHDVFFAIAKGQWMCGGVSPEILGRVTEIIENGDNLIFYRELDATDADLRLREKNLRRFLSSLQTPRSTTRKRKKSESSYIPRVAPVRLPHVKETDLVAFPVGDQWRVLLITSIIKNKREQFATVFLWRKFFDSSPSWETLDKSSGILLGHVPADVFPKSFSIIGKQGVLALNLMARFYAQSWREYLFTPTKAEQLYQPLPEDLCVPYRIARENAIKEMDVIVQRNRMTRGKQ